MSHVSQRPQTITARSCDREQMLRVRVVERCGALSGLEAAFARPTIGVLELAMHVRLEKQDRQS